MLALIAIWALAEALVFFIVADVPIMALGLRAGVRKALIGALVAAVFAAMGGSVLYYLTVADAAAVWRMLVMVPGVDGALIERVLGEWSAQGEMAMVIGSLSGVPYKLYAYAAAMHLPHVIGLPEFIIYSLLARLPRFVLVALIAGWVGPRLIQRFGAAPVWISFAAGWSGFYAIYWSVMGF